MQYEGRGNVQTATRGGWVRIGAIWWIVFGTGGGILAAFKPALTYLSVRDTMPTIICMVFASAFTGALHGLLAFAKFKASYTIELPVARMAVLVWGPILGAILYGLFFLLPSIEGGMDPFTGYVFMESSLRSLTTRCWIGVGVGLLSGAMMVGSAHPD